MSFGACFIDFVLDTVLLLHKLFCMVHQCGKWRYNYQSVTDGSLFRHIYPRYVLDESAEKYLNLKQLSAYSKKLIEGVLENRADLQSALSEHLKKGWRLERVSQIVVAIMEVALFEIKNSDEIDPKAAVNEALNLCDEFAEPKEKPFINGMLANFV